MIQPEALPPIPPSLAFPGRTCLRIEEIAERLECHPRHIQNLIECGALQVVDISSTPAGRRCLRVPIESWESYVRKHTR